MHGTELLIAWRSRLGYSQAKAAELCGTSQPGYYAWEKGAIPTVAAALRIAKATNEEVPVTSWAPSESTPEVGS